MAAFLLLVILVLALDLPGLFEDEEENEDENDSTTRVSGQRLIVAGLQPGDSCASRASR
jgi:hypothetical protein